MTLLRPLLKTIRHRLPNARSAIFAAFLMMSCQALAQGWPAKAVRVIVPVGPGVTPDLVMRIIAERLATKLGKPFIVDNMPGGGGVPAANAMVQAAPDGYTFYLGGVGVTATDRYMFKSLPYDPDKDFAPVAILYDSTAFALAVNPDLPVKSIAELITLAKAQPGKLSYGSETAGVQAITGQWFNIRAGIDMVWVPYKTPPQLITDAIAGRTPVIFTSALLLQPYHISGKLRVIGITSDKRLPTLPGVPTIAETVPGYRVAGIGILFAPARTPTEIIQRLNREIDPIVKDPEYVKRLNSYAFTTFGGAGTLGEIAQFMKTERNNWDTVFRGVKIEPQ